MKITHNARRNRRSAVLVALAAAAALSLTACGGGEDAAAGPAKKDTASHAQSTGTGSAKEQTTTEAASTVSKASSKASSKARTTKLVDGSTARIHKVGSQHYRADIVSDGAVIGQLKANGTDAGLDANGMYVALTLDGKVNSWMGGEHQGPGTFKLAGGWKAKVTKVGELHYRAQILGSDGSVMGTLDANEHDDGAVANGIYIVLSAGGVISSHA